MKLILSFFLIIFLTITQSQAGVREDFKYFLDLTTSKKCMKLMKHFSKVAKEDEALFIKVFGPAFTPADFKAKNSKQRKFQEIVEKGNSIIKPEHRNAILPVVNQSGCRMEVNNITDFILKDMAARDIAARDNLANEIKNGSAKYSDVWKTILASNDIIEEWILYIVQKDPNILASFEDEFQEYVSVLQSSMMPVLKLMEKYDL